MSKTIIAALGLVDRTLSAGQSLAYHEITLSKDGVAGEPVQTNEASITFEGLEPGTYVASGFSVVNNADGSTTQLDTATSDPITIAADAPPPPPPVTAKVLASLTLSLQDPTAGN